MQQRPALCKVVEEHVLPHFAYAAALVDLSLPLAVARRRLEDDVSTSDGADLSLRKADVAGLVRAAPPVRTDPT
jgi:hypothetical protein